MATDKKRFLSLVTEHDNSMLEDVEKRIRNSAALDASNGIAIKILVRLDELKWTQKDLAAAMGVKPQQVNKIVRGKQNLTLDTIVRLQEILNISILAQEEGAKQKTVSVTFKEDTKVYIPQTRQVIAAYSYMSSKPISRTSAFHNIKNSRKLAHTTN